MSENWNRAELEAAVSAYLGMLESQKTGNPVNKAEVNRKLRQSALTERSKAAVEYRMQNISAILADEGRDWLQGYPPAKHVGPGVRKQLESILHDAPPKGRRESLLDGLSREHVLGGIGRFEKGERHRFKDSTKFDLIHDGKPYPPKAIVGLAAIERDGNPLDPSDFTGGLGSKCFRVLTELGFEVVPKPESFQPTADPKALEEMTREAVASPSLPKPMGAAKPLRVSTAQESFVRDPLVRAFVLRRANGVCECCGDSAPFLTVSGQPFLEVHHVESLANGGADTVENSASICPNCHRECHLGQRAEDLKKHLLSKLECLYSSSHP